MSRSARLGALLLLVVAAASCRTPGPLPATPLEGAARCLDVSYRGRYEPASGADDGRHVRISLRGCVDGTGPVVFEVRGRVGGAVVSGAVDDGRLLLLFPRERRAVRGADRPEVWRRWASVPVEERLLRRALSPRRAVGDAPGRVGPWSVTVDAGAGGRLALEARSDDGDRLSVERYHIAPAGRPPTWPPIPSGFEVVAAAGPGANAVR